MSGIGVIHNPFAKRNRRSPWLADEIKKAVDGIGILRITENLQDVNTAAREFLDKNIDILAVNGGDGTLHRVLTAFVHIYGNRPLPRLLIFRGGTMNLVATSLNIPYRPLSAIRLAADGYRYGKQFKTFRQDILKVNDLYGFISGGCAIASFMDEYYRVCKTGPAQALKIVSRMISSALFHTPYALRMFRPIPMKVWTDGVLLENTQYSFFLASTVKDLAFGFTPAPSAGKIPEKFHFMAGNMKPGELVKYIPELYTGTPLRHPGVCWNGPAKEAKIETDDPIRYTIDGEMYETEGELRYFAGPRLTVIAP